jgi:hypothetical protein
MRGSRALGRRPGLTIWQSRDELEAMRRRQLVPVLLLAALAALLCLVWLGAKTDKDSTLTAWLLLELVVVVPLLFGARRVNRLSALIARAEAYSQEDQAAEAAALRKTDESMWRVRQLVSSLDDGAARKEAQEGLAAAEGAAEVLRPLVRRRTQLDHLVKSSASRSARGKLRTTLEACEADIDRLESTIAGLAASIASLVDAASDAAFDRQLELLRQAIEDVTALVAAFDDIVEIEEVAGLRSDPL